MNINKKEYQCSNFFLCQKLKSRVSFIQLKPIVDISVSPAALKVLLLLNPTCLYVLNCERNFSYPDPD
jgi:hypothetical protein